MATLNTSSNGPSIAKSYQAVVDAPPPSGGAASSPTFAQWALFSVSAPLANAFQRDSSKESVLKVQTTGGEYTSQITLKYVPDPVYRGGASRPRRRVLRRPYSIRICKN